MIFHFNLCLVCSFAADAAADDDVATDDLDDVEKNCAYSHGRRWILILTRPTCCRRVRWSECNEVLEKHLEGCDVDNLPPNFDVSEIVWCFNFVDIDDEANDDSEFIRLPEVTDNILIPDRAMILLLSNLCTPQIPKARRRQQPFLTRIKKQSVSSRCVVRASLVRAPNDTKIILLEPRVYLMLCGRESQ